MFTRHGNSGTSAVLTVCLSLAMTTTVRGELLVELLPGGVSSNGQTWTNNGTLGGVFNATQSPTLTGNSGVLFNGNIVPGVVLHGPNGGWGGNAEYFTSAFNAPDSLEGSNPRTVEVWILNPNLDVPEETVVSWGSRGATGANLALNYDSSPDFGAVATFNADAGFEDFSGAPAVPLTNRWHHLAYTFNGTEFGLYIDGNSAGAFTPAAAIITAADQPFRIGFQNGGGTGGIGLTATINTVRIHDEVIGPSAIANAYAAGPFVTEVPYSLEIDRDSGGIVFRNHTVGPLQIIGYSVLSNSGALDPSGWTPITDRTDAPAPGNGTFDDDNQWTILSDANSHTDISEFELEGGDGGRLDAMAPLVISPGGAWIQSLVEDLRIRVKLDDGSIFEVAGSYVGNEGSPFIRSDLDFDNDIDGDDWATFVNNNLALTDELSLAEAYQLGDLDGDGDNDFQDFRIFQSDFDMLNGPGSFASLLSGVPVPEPAGIYTLLFGCVGLACRYVRPGHCASRREMSCK